MRDFKAVSVSVHLFGSSQSSPRPGARVNDNVAFIGENLNESLQQIDRLLRGMQARYFFAVSLELKPVFDSVSVIPEFRQLVAAEDKGIFNSSDNTLST